MLTLSCDYYATGEGRTIMVLFTQRNRKDAVIRFKELFDPYYLPGVLLNDGLDFEFSGAELLLSDKIKQYLTGNFDKGMVEYYGSLHVNFA